MTYIHASVHLFIYSNLHIYIIYIYSFINSFILAYITYIHSYTHTFIYAPGGAERV